MMMEEHGLWEDVVHDEVAKGYATVTMGERGAREHAESILKYLDMDS